MLLGIAIQRLGSVRFAFIGVGIVGVGSLLGAQVDVFYALLVSRALEGLGWIMAVIALPPILTSLAQPKDRSLVLAIWGAFVPVGAGVMLLLSPVLLSSGGWRFSWSAAGCVSLLASALVILVIRSHAEQLQPLSRAGRVSGDKFTDLRRSLIWMLSGCFLLYSLQFVSVTSFLPSLLLDTTSLTLSTASRLTAFVIISNALGNILAGYLLRRGISHVPILSAGALGMGLFALIVFNEAVPVEIRLLCAFGFASVGGLIPGTCFATLPKAVSVASAASLLIGLMMQSAGVGQLLGGVVVPIAVDYAGTWRAAGGVSFAIGVAGALLALFSRIKT